jgi:hypothetical protein
MRELSLDEQHAVCGALYAVPPIVAVSEIWCDAPDASDAGSVGDTVSGPSCPPDYWGELVPPPVPNPPQPTHPGGGYVVVRANTSHDMSALLESLRALP